MRSHPSTFYGCLPAGHIGTTWGIGTCHHPGTSQRNSVNLAERQWAFLCFVWKSKVKKKISFACLVCGVTVPYNKFPVLRGRHQVSEGQSSVKAAEAMKIKTRPVPKLEFKLLNIWYKLFCRCTFGCKLAINHSKCDNGLRLKHWYGL